MRRCEHEHQTVPPAARTAASARADRRRRGAQPAEGREVIHQRRAGIDTGEAPTSRHASGCQVLAGDLAVECGPHSAAAPGTVGQAETAARRGPHANQHTSHQRVPLQAGWPYPRGRAHGPKPVFCPGSAGCPTSGTSRSSPPHDRGQARATDRPSSSSTAWSGPGTVPGRSRSCGWQPSPAIAPGSRPRTTRHTQAPGQARESRGHHTCATSSTAPSAPEPSTGLPRARRAHPGHENPRTCRTSHGPDRRSLLLCHPAKVIPRSTKIALQHNRSRPVEDIDPPVIIKAGAVHHTITPGMSHAPTDMQIRETRVRVVHPLAPQAHSVAHNAPILHGHFGSPFPPGT